MGFNVQKRRKVEENASGCDYQSTAFITIFRKKKTKVLDSEVILKKKKIKAKWILVVMMRLLPVRRK